MDLLDGSCSESYDASRGWPHILRRRIAILDPSDAPGQVPVVVSRWLAPTLPSSVELPTFDPVPSLPLCERTHRGSPLNRQTRLSAGCSSAKGSTPKREEEPSRAA